MAVLQRFGCIKGEAHFTTFGCFWIDSKCKEMLPKRYFDHAYQVSSKHYGAIAETDKINFKTSIIMVYLVS